MEVDLKEFDKSEKRELLVGILEMNGATLPLLGRERQLKEIGETVLTVKSYKTSVGILCSTRGMGKTALLKALVDPDSYKVVIDNKPLNEARAVGRLAVVNLSKHSISSTVDLANFAESFWVEIILRHLWLLFKECRVGEISFDSYENMVSRLRIGSVEKAFRVWETLTNQAYGVNSEAKPIILLDEIGNLVEETTVKSDKKSKSGEFLNHTYRH